MEPEELEALESREQCGLCGRDTGADSDRVFAYGADSVLCWECATARGGRYDAVLDRWDEAPDLEGLPDEAYGAAPHEVRRGRG